MIELYNEDCMEGMKRYPDNHFELCICDPPYGIGFGEFNRTNKDPYGRRIKANKYKNDKWDNNIPKDGYFTELQRISKHQVIWGGNYFPFLTGENATKLKTISEFHKYIHDSSSNWLFWYKQNPVPNFADGELAWTSFRMNKQFNFRYYGNLEGDTSASIKIHPTQKPVKLYEWLLTNYAKDGDKILDTHGGSMSIALACHNMGFDLTLFELDKDYFEAGKARLEQHQKQQRMF